MSHFQAQTTTECLSLWCGLTVGHTEPHNDIRIQRSATRTEAAAWVYGDYTVVYINQNAMLGALAAADAHDAAHGIHRVSLDEATVERAARAWVENGPVEATWENTSDRHKSMTKDRIRAVLAAAVEAGQ